MKKNNTLEAILIKVKEEQTSDRHFSTKTWNDNNERPYKKTFKCENIIDIVEAKRILTTLKEEHIDKRKKN